MSERFTLNAGTFLAWALAAWSILTGIAGIMAWDAKGARFGRDVAEFFGRPESPMALVLAIVALVAGVVLLIASLGVLKPGLSTAAVGAVALWWLVRAVILLVVADDSFRPSTLAWWRDLSWHLVLALAAWRTRPGRA